MSITGEGTWEDGTTADKQVTANCGIAVARIKPTTTAGQIIITARAGGLNNGVISLTTNNAPAKVVLTTVSIVLPNDNTSTTLITGYIKDKDGNTVTAASGTFVFSLSGIGSGTLWVGGVQVSSRETIQNGETYNAESRNKVR